VTAEDLSARNEWSTGNRHAPSLLDAVRKRMRYSLETEADDDNEYIIFENTRLESDSEVDR